MSAIDPGHYKGGILESIQVIEAYRLGFHLGNVLKYILRHPAKNGVQDIEKAIRYLVMFRASKFANSLQYDLWSRGGVGLPGHTPLTIAQDFGLTHARIQEALYLLLSMPFLCHSYDYTAALVEDALGAYLNGN